VNGATKSLIYGKEQHWGNKVRSGRLLKIQIMVEGGCHVGVRDGVGNCNGVGVGNAMMRAGMARISSQTSSEPVPSQSRSSMPFGSVWSIWRPEAKPES
jgi:hypothetical protein